LLCFIYIYCVSYIAVDSVNNSLIIIIIEFTENMFFAKELCHCLVSVQFVLKGTILHVYSLLLSL